MQLGPVRVPVGVSLHHRRQLRVILGHGWASEDYTAAHIDPTSRSVGWLIAECGTPRRMKAAYLSDDQATRLAEHATRLRTRAAMVEAGAGAT